MSVQQNKMDDLIKTRFTADEIEVYRKHFDLFDLNGDGVISTRELEKASRHFGYRMSKKEIKVQVCMLACIEYNYT